MTLSLANSNSISSTPSPMYRWMKDFLLYNLSNSPISLSRMGLKAVVLAIEERETVYYSDLEQHTQWLEHYLIPNQQKYYVEELTSVI